MIGGCVEVRRVGLVGDTGVIVGNFPVNGTTVVGMVDVVRGWNDGSLTGGSCGIADRGDNCEIGGNLIIGDITRGGDDVEIG